MDEVTYYLHIIHSTYIPNQRVYQKLNRCKIDVTSRKNQLEASTDILFKKLCLK